jgi:hypothetical protein
MFIYRKLQMFIAAFVALFKCSVKHLIMEDYKKKLGNLAMKIKIETPQIPIQQVQPVKALAMPAGEEEARFNNWIPKGLKRKIKAFGVQNDISQKDITIRALERFLKENGVQ